MADERFVAEVGSTSNMTDLVDLVNSQCRKGVFESMVNMLSILQVHISLYLSQEVPPIEIMERMMGGEVLRHPPNREVFDGKGREARSAKSAMPVCCRRGVGVHVGRVVLLIAVSFARLLEFGRVFHRRHTSTTRNHCTGYVGGPTRKILHCGTLGKDCDIA